MTRQEKNNTIDELTNQLNGSSVVYLTDVKGLDAENTTKLRRECYENNISLRVVKNTLLKRAMDNADVDYNEFYDTLKGNTSLMIAEVGNAPAKAIKKIRGDKAEKPSLKAAYIDEGYYVGDNYLQALIDLKSKDEVIGDIIMLLQSPAKNVLSSLQSGQNKISGLLKALEERK